MKQLRNGTLIVLVALIAMACGGAETGNAPQATGSTPQPTSDGSPAQQLKGQAITDALQDSDLFILDVRTAAEIPEQGTIEGAVRIHIDELAGRLDELPRDRPILTL